MTELKYPNKSRGVAISLAYFLGLFGVHRFYLGDTKKGKIYLALCWTAVPGFIGFYDGFKYLTNPEWFTENSLPDGVLMNVTGANGKVTLYDGRLEISREDIGMVHRIQHGFKGTKEIPYDSITSMQFREPGSVSRGYIQFGQSGFSESGGGLTDAASDENTVLFDKSDLSDFKELRGKVRELKNGDVEETTGSTDGAIEKLRERYAEGDIDEEEYEQRKQILQQD